MLEGKNLLISYLRACQQNHEVLSFTKPASISLLRKAWNAFARLLDIDWSESFQCLLCGPTLHTVVCDGTMIGFWKDFLPEISSSITSTPPIVRSRHQERILISSVKARSLLLKYSGYTKDHKCLKPHKELTRPEFRELCHLICSDFPSLSSFLTKLCSDTGKAKSPSEFFAELARNSPACGKFQIRGEQQVFDTISLIVSDSIDVFKSTNHSHLVVLQTTVPILAKILQASEWDQRGRPSNEVCNILLHILEVCQAPFLESPPSSSRYAAPTEDVLSLFPSLPEELQTILQTQNSLREH